MKRSLIAVAAATVAVLVAPPTWAAHSPPGVIFVDDDCDAPGDGSAADPFCTITEAEAHATPGDTVRVRAGTYSETVTADVSDLNFEGARAGDDPRDGYGAVDRQTIMDNTGGSFSLTANNIVLDGFTITDGSALPLGAGVATSAGSSGYVIRNSVFRENTIGIQLASEGSALTQVKRNIFFANNAPGSGSGTGIFSGSGLNNALISSNRFTDNDNASTVIASDNPPTISNSDVTISKNRMDNTFVLTNTSDGSISENVGRDLNGSAVFLGGDNLRIRVAENDLRGGTTGVTASLAFGGAASEDLTILRNVIRNMSSRGISFGADTVDDSVVRRNDIRRIDGEAIRVLADNTGNTLSGNVARSLSDPDVSDASAGGGTEGTANTWLRNDCVTSDPDGLCDA